MDPMIRCIARPKAVVMSNHLPGHLFATMLSVSDCSMSKTIIVKATDTLAYYIGEYLETTISFFLTELNGYDAQ